MIELHELSGATKDETEVMNAAVRLWNAYCAMENKGEHEQHQIHTAVNTIQSFMALRVAARMFPEYWKVP